MYNADTGAFDDNKDGKKKTNAAHAANVAASIANQQAKVAAKKAAADEKERRIRAGLVPEEAQKEAARLAMVSEAGRAPGELRARIGQMEGAMGQEGINTRQVAAANLGRAMPFGSSGGGAMRAGLGSAMQTAAQIGQRQQTGIGRLATMETQAAQLGVDANQAALSMSKSAERQSKTANYFQLMNQAYESQGLGGAKSIIESLLLNETDPEVVMAMRAAWSDLARND
tara:strand:+ start:349 stop:1032 length:684 start_codon:yes stop_codon:yes gene_type:complete